MTRLELCKLMKEALFSIKEHKDTFDILFSKEEKDLYSIKTRKGTILNDFSTVQFDILSYLKENTHVSDISFEAITGKTNLFRNEISIYTHNLSPSRALRDLRKIYEQLKLGGVLDIETLSKYDQNIAYNFPTPLFKILTLQTKIIVTKNMSPSPSKSGVKSFSIEFLPNK